MLGAPVSGLLKGHTEAVLSVATGRVASDVVPARC